MPKITLLADDLYVIRSTRTLPDGTVKVSYYESPAMWTSSPTKGTIFQCFDVGQAHLTMYHSRDRAKKGWADGSTEVMDVVPLYGEILHSPNGKTFIVKK